MNEVQTMAEAFNRAAENLGRDMARWREAMGLPDPETVGYVGNRCGWYPAKPKRKRQLVTRR